MQTDNSSPSLWQIAKDAVAYYSHGTENLSEDTWNYCIQHILDAHASRVPRITESFVLPTWEECEKSIDNGIESPLERFIYEYEPGEGGEDITFRKRLQQVLNFFVDNKPTTL